MTPEETLAFAKLQTELDWHRGRIVKMAEWSRRWQERNEAHQPEEVVRQLEALAKDLGCPLELNGPAPPIAAPVDRSIIEGCAQEFFEVGRAGFAAAGGYAKGENWETIGYAHQAGWWSVAACHWRIILHVEREMAELRDEITRLRAVLREERVVHTTLPGIP